MVNWNMCAEALEKKMFSGFKDFYNFFKEVKKKATKENKEILQGEWEKLRWTEEQEDKYRDWAMNYLIKKGVSKYLAKRELAWFMLKFAPRIKKEGGKNEESI